MTLQSIIAKILLFPFSMIYGLIIGGRNILYETEIIKSTSFSLPVISVGNLSVGGAGKTPHIEYLIRLLNPYIDIGTLSRGYKRQTNGFRFVNSTDNVIDTGDEPLMYAKKYKGIVVAVGENRALSIPQMVGKYPSLQAILLDDAFQHRAISPGLNILLTTWDDPFTKDFLMPMGRLREWRSSYERADIIIVSKCPFELSKRDKEEMIKKINPQSHQKVFFSLYQYGHPYSFFDGRKRKALNQETDVILISAIANTNYLLDYLEPVVSDVHHMDYEDHHLFSDFDISYINEVFTNRDTKNKIIITTEKDATRLSLHYNRLKELNLPIFVLPTQVVFYDDDGHQFNNQIRDFLYNFKV